MAHQCTESHEQMPLEKQIIEGLESVMPLSELTSRIKFKDTEKVRQSILEFKVTLKSEEHATKYGRSVGEFCRRYKHLPSAHVADCLAKNSSGK